MIKMFRSLYSRWISKYYSRALVIVMSVTMLTVTGCNRINIAKESGKSDEIKIGVCIHNGYEPFVWEIGNYMSEWCRAKEKETGTKISIEIVSSKGSQLTQNEQVERFIAKDVDVLCVNLVDRTDPTVIIDNAMESDTPVIFFNRELVKEDLDMWEKLYYVGAVARQSGRLQAEIIIEALSDPDKFAAIDVNHNGTIQYVMLEGEPGHQDALIRTSVCTDVLKDAGIPIEKIGDENANWDRDQAKTKMMALIDRYPSQIEMVIANDDVMALGALEALEEAGYPAKPFIVGVNGNEEALEAISTGKMNGTVYNDAKGKANAIMELACSLASSDPLPEDINISFDKYVYLPYKSITADNVYEFRNLN